MVGKPVSTVEMTGKAGTIRVNESDVASMEKKGYKLLGDDKPEAEKKPAAKKDDGKKDGNK